MGRRASTSCSLIAMAIAAGSLAIHAQRPAPPNLEGIWSYATMTPLERPRDLAAKSMLTPEEAADYERQTNGRTSLIVEPPDGRVPAMTPEAQQRAAARTQARRARGPADGPEDRALNERCLNWTVAGPPMLPGVYNNNVQIIQTRDYVALVNEMIHDARIVPMDGRPHGTVPRWMGDSRGRWDGATLVVDTVEGSQAAFFAGAAPFLPPLATGVSANM